MADLVFVRANKNAPVREGAATSCMPSALPGTGSVLSYGRPDMFMPPSGQLGFAVNNLAGRFENIGYYYDQSGAPPNQNPGQPTF